MFKLEFLTDFRRSPRKFQPLPLRRVMKMLKRGRRKNLRNQSEAAVSSGGGEVRWVQGILHDT